MWLVSGDTIGMSSSNGSFKNFNHSGTTIKIFKIGKNIIWKNLRMSYYKGPLIILKSPPIYYKI